MDCFEFADLYLHPYKVRAQEINPQVCPYCGGGSHGRDKYKFFLNYEKKTFKCHRASCDVRGTFRKLAKDFGEEVGMPEDTKELITRPKKKYKKPKINSSRLSQKAIDYANKRKISEQTLNDWGVEEKDGNYVFKYSDENNNLVFVKYRPAKKIIEGERKGWREPGGKTVLWGMNKVDKSKPLVITEGEFDALAIYEAGIKNVTSVPSGSSDYTWIDNCWEWLQGIEEIVIFGDTDEPGKEMSRSLVAKLGEERCYLVDYSYKDPNELLYFEGAKAVKEAFENRRPVPFEGLIDLGTVVPVDDKDLPKVKSNIKYLDSLIGGWILGELSVWTGKREEGKSTFLGQMLLEAIDQGESVCAYSGELTAQKFQNWINRQAAGEHNLRSYTDEATGKEHYYPSRGTHDKIREWYKGRMFLFDNGVRFDEAEENSIIKVFKYAAKRYDCRLFLVDNLMSARYDGLNESDWYRRQAIFTGELVRFAKAYNVHVHLVAHPRKGEKIEGCDDVGGLGEITDRADNVFVIEKLSESAETDSRIRILKHRAEGSSVKPIGLNFNVKTKRFYLPSEGDIREYGWEICEQQELDEYGIAKDVPF